MNHAAFRKTRTKRCSWLTRRRFFGPTLVMTVVCLALLRFNIHYYRYYSQTIQQQQQQPAAANNILQQEVNHQRRFQAVVGSSDKQGDSRGQAPSVRKAPVSTMSISNSTTFTTYTKNTRTRPPLSSLNLLNNKQISGDVQFLLDFAIVGFAKCGTTSILTWLAQDSRIATFEDEIWSLKRNLPHQFVRRLYYGLPPDDRSTGTYYKRGYKNPAEITDSLVLPKYYRTHWPTTRLIVSVRNPYEWFISLYNFRVQNLETLPMPDQLVGPCMTGMKSTCTHKGNFAYHLMRLGKQIGNAASGVSPASRFTMSEAEQAQLEYDIVNYYKLLAFNHTAIEPQPNPVFFMDVSQLSDLNETRRRQFQMDMTDFLQLNDGKERNEQENASSSTLLLPDPLLAPRIKPGHAPISDEIQAAKAARQLTLHKLCREPRYEALRLELQRLATTSSAWIRHVFLNAHGVYCSDKQHLQALLEQWMVDPCSKIQ